MIRYIYILSSIILLVAYAALPSRAEALDLDAIVNQIEASDNATQVVAEGRRASDQSRLEASAAAGGVGLSEPAVPVRNASELSPSAAVEPAEIPAQNLANANAPLITDLPEDPRESVRDVLMNLGLTEGENIMGDQSLFVALEFSEVNIAPGQRGYVLARDIAFQTADLLARQQLATYLSSDLAQERAFAAMKDESVEVSDDPQEAARQASQGIAEDNLDAQLVGLGVDPSLYQDLPPEEKRLIFEEHFMQNIQRTASERIMGAAVLATAEGKINGRQAVAVAVVTSQASAVLANLALSSADYASRTPPQDSRANVFKRIPLRNGPQLAGYFGAQLINDGYGNYYIVGVGQAEFDPDRRGAERRATSRADLNADAAILSFITETIDSESSLEKEQLMQELSSGENSVQQVERFRERVQGRSAMQDIRGIGRIGAQTVNIDGVHAVIVVKMWSPFSASFANQIRERMQQAARPGSMGQAGEDAPTRGQEEPAGGVRRSGPGDY